ncbi:MAG: NAD(P) transhydrogenase subunit alpha [Gammaproteobacteria bacterium]|nr:NAD(P) transhydrogenase subunit alpha [Gammaproteobacteria bacterium]MDH4316083.1 NAD(P) transhydrogenase subunit alpha [Gammaproteobacteria bacterium]MDH5215456.1 NAD(P) transhydrogenase subunit alpha [Gammaproteobacteria bacterium]MDH5499736.1 NAD(P) transhydrogenase subunit alpha [Gammaproteobacteria bacterium]
MPLTVGVLKETIKGETRVALTPEITAKLMKLGVSVIMENGAGDGAQIPDADYKDVEFTDAKGVLAKSGVLLTVQPASADAVRKLRNGAVVAGLMYGHINKELVAALQKNNIVGFAMELIPRISRAQSMDVLSSQAAVAGYQATLIAATTLDKFFPMLTTAAGTIRPAQVLVIGAGVAGLQAIATAKRLGAVVKAYDVRSATREQIQSLGAKFVETGVSAEGEGGYARELTDEEKKQQQAALEKEIAVSDVVISTAAIPGRPAPKIITAEAARAMKPGAVIVDLAAETGGNCALTKAGETVVDNKVKIVGPVNLPAALGRHASDMYARNLYNFLSPAIDKSELKIDWEDEVFASSVLTRDGEIKHKATRESIEGGAS